MKSGKRVLALLMAFLLLGCGCIVNVNAASLNGVESEKSGTMQDTQAQENAKLAKSTADKVETESDSASKSQAETSDEQTENKGAAGIEAQTEAAQTESENVQAQSNAVEQPAKVSKSAEGVFISSPDDPELISLIPDENFRKAIYDSLASYTRYRGRTYKNGWLGGDPDDPPETVQEILETYQGPINASGRGITDLTGIGYLKIAGTAHKNYKIDLSNNSIENLMPIADACNASEYHYGGLVQCEDGTNGVEQEYRAVEIDLTGNPLRCIPKYDRTKRKLGYLVFSPLGRWEAEFVEPENLRLYSLRENTESFTGVLQVGFRQYESVGEGAEYVPVDSLDIEDEYMTIEKEGEINARVSNITRSGTTYLHIGSNFRLTSDEPTSVTGYPRGVSVSLSSLLRPTFTIFDKVEVYGEYRGSTQVHKTDELTGSPLKGAVFSLYKKGENGKDTLIQDGLVTDKDGYTEKVTGLEPGKYYFLETKAPEGYQLSQEPYELTIQKKEVTPSITGGLKTLNYQSVGITDGEGNLPKISAEAKENETYITSKMTDTEFGGKALKFQTDSADGDISSVKITYSSLITSNGERKSVVETYDSVEAAESQLNTYINENKITGSVKAELVYVGSSSLCEAGNPPYYTTVVAQKSWVGIEAGDVLPKVTYILQRKQDEDGAWQEVNRYEVTSYELPELSDLMTEEELENLTEEEKKEILEELSQDAADHYRYVFETDSKGGKLPLYSVDSEGSLVRYYYDIVEEIDGESFERGETEEEITEKLPDGERVMEGEITIPITNYKIWASIIIYKIDAVTNEKLSDVVFKLEKQSEDGQWELVETKPTGKEGEVKFEKLDRGEYRVTEIKTQAGYNLLKEPLMISIPNLTKPNAEREFVFYVENSKEYALPQAGGFGSRWFVWGGMILLSASGIVWSQKKKLSKKMR